MQDFEQALRAEIVAAIPALGGRVYPLFAPEAVKKNGVPYLIYASSEGLRDKALDGYLQSKEVRAELNVIAERYEDMKAITHEVVALLVDMEGRQIGTDGPFIKELTYQMPVELNEPQPQLHRCVVEFSAHFDEEG
jgi:Protein of unknown function (DUF3168).